MCISQEKLLVQFKELLGFPSKADPNVSMPEITVAPTVWHGARWTTGPGLCASRELSTLQGQLPTCRENLWAAQPRPTLGHQGDESHGGHEPQVWGRR